MQLSIFKKIFSALIPVLILTAGCTDEVGDAEINVIQGNFAKAASAEVAEGMLKDAMYLLHDAREHKYQYQFNLHIDNYAGYLTVANSLQGRLPSTYFINPGFESGPLANMLWVARAVVPVINSADSLKIPELGAIASIMFNFSASEMVDVYGPMPYFAYKRLQTDPPVEYDKVSVVYKEILKDLKAAQQALKELRPALTDEQKARLKRMDKIGKGDVDNWIRFANSLRLRMAMRMVKVEPALARAEAEAAYAAGILEEDYHSNIELDMAGGRHPLYVISLTWDDSRLNASFENILKRVNSPLLEVWFSPAKTGLRNNKGEITIPDTATNVYVGIRSGTGVHPKENRRDTYLMFSGVNPNYFGVRNISLFKVSESLFLCAEAKLRGWNVGSKTDRTYYENAIKRSLRDEGISSNAYIGYKDVVEVPYRDLWNPANNYSENLVKLGVRWDVTFTQEQKLEQIITQKYIANFPQSLEAWSEYRRTGYPRLIPVTYDAGDNSIPTGDHIRRMTFQTSGSVSLEDVVLSAMPALKEEDSSGFMDDVQGARLWWDVKEKGNF